MKYTKGPAIRRPRTSGIVDAKLDAVPRHGYSDRRPQCGRCSLTGWNPRRLVGLLLLARERSLVRVQPEGVVTVPQTTARSSRPPLATEADRQADRSSVGRALCHPADLHPRIVLSDVSEANDGATSVGASPKRLLVQIQLCSNGLHPRILLLRGVGLGYFVGSTPIAAAGATRRTASARWGGLPCPLQPRSAGVVELVPRRVANAEAAGSNPATRSRRLSGARRDARRLGCHTSRRESDSLNLHQGAACPSVSPF